MQLISKKLLLLAFTACFFLISCNEKEEEACTGGLSGSMYRSTALRDFPVCGEFGLQKNPDIAVVKNGETRIIGKKYAFENIGEPFESVYYVKGEVHIYRVDSSDYMSSAFSFDVTQLAIPQTDIFEDDGMVVKLIFSHDKNNPSHQGPVQYTEWIDWRIQFQKDANTDHVSGSFFSDRGTFWIPGPASSSYAGLDLKFKM